ncbi:hypothetical protein DL96DRAFT_1683364 [Flagelloscypha sp. PMI_526]|nr:hypothetical protein DL96DRAFT_1683364 [Flagelloscypha sp. PMI_526]
MARVAIRSVQSGKYLSLDGRGITASVQGGAGTAFTQTYIGEWEAFILHTSAKNIVAFESAQFNNVYLRLVAENVDQGSLVGPGGGKVNGQWGCGTREKFLIKKAAGDNGQKGIVGIESQSEPGRFLRMQGDANVVNVQGSMGGLEEFEILIISS